MSDSRLGRVVDGRIELDGSLAELEGKTVRVTVEVVEKEPIEELRAEFAEQGISFGPASAEDLAAVEESRKKNSFITHEEMRTRLTARRE